MKIKSIDNIINFTKDVVAKRNIQVQKVLDKREIIEEKITKATAERKESVINGTPEDYNNKDNELANLKTELGNITTYANQLYALPLVNDTDLKELPAKVFTELAEKENALIKEIEPQLLSMLAKLNEFNEDCNRGNNAIAEFYKDTRNEELYKEFHYGYKNNFESVLYYVANHLEDIKNLLNER